MHNNQEKTIESPEPGELKDDELDWVLGGYPNSDFIQDAKEKLQHILQNGAPAQEFQSNNI